MEAFADEAVTAARAEAAAEKFFQGLEHENSFTTSERLRELIPEIVGNREIAPAQVIDHVTQEIAIPVYRAGLFAELASAQRQEGLKGEPSDAERIEHLEKSNAYLGEAVSTLVPEVSSARSI